MIYYSVYISGYCVCFQLKIDRFSARRQISVFSGTYRAYATFLKVTRVYADCPCKTCVYPEKRDCAKG